MFSVLFNITLGNVIRKTLQIETLNLNKGNILLAYTDDIVVIKKSREYIQSTIEELIKVGKDIGLTINN